MSVCIPAYNQPDLLARALTSTLKQTYRHLEILIMDDSTHDAVGHLVLEETDPRVRYHRNSMSLGPARNWNSAIGEARGKYVKFLHHDDWFASDDALRHFVDAAVCDQADFVFSASNAMGQDGKTRSVNRVSSELVGRLSSNPALLLRAGNVIGGPSATLFSRDTSIRFDVRLRWLVDMDFYISYIRRHPRTAYVDELLIHTTSGSPHQVTAASENNAAVELVEWDLVYRKQDPKAVAGRLHKLRTLSMGYEALSLHDAWVRALPHSTRMAMRVGIIERALRRSAREVRSRARS